MMLDLKKARWATRGAVAAAVSLSAWLSVGYAWSSMGSLGANEGSTGNGGSGSAEFKLQAWELGERAFGEGSPAPDEAGYKAWREAVIQSDVKILPEFDPGCVELFSIPADGAQNVCILRSSSGSTIEIKGVPWQLLNLTGRLGWIAATYGSLSGTGNVESPAVAAAISFVSANWGNGNAVESRGLCSATQVSLIDLEFRQRAHDLFGRLDACEAGQALISSQAFDEVYGNSMANIPVMTVGHVLFVLGDPEPKVAINTGVAAPGESMREGPPSGKIFIDCEYWVSLSEASKDLIVLHELLPVFGLEDHDFIHSLVTLDSCQAIH